jgi:fructokinase
LAEDDERKIRKKTILAFGEVLWDILPSCTVLGGASLNFTYRVNSLGHTGMMISRLGKDDLGNQAFAQMKTLGLDGSLVQWEEEFPTGTVDVSFDAANNPDFVINPDVAYDQIELTSALETAVANCDCFYFGTLAQRAAKSRATLWALIEMAAKSLKLLDINLRKKCYSRETITYSLQKADILKLNDEEAYQLGDILDMPFRGLVEFSQRIMAQWDLQYCLVTLAGKGVLARSRTDEQVYVPGWQIALQDSVGSGDAFTAGFVHTILQEADLQAACEFGNIVGAIVATQTGATTAVTAEQIDRFIKEQYDLKIHPELKRLRTD